MRGLKRFPITDLQHGLWVRQLLSLVDLYVSLQERKIRLSITKVFL